MSLSRDLARRTLPSVVDATSRCSFTIWGFGVGPALVGLLRAAEAVARPELVDRVAALVRPTLSRGPDATDHLIAVEVLLELARLRPGLDTGSATARFVDAVVGAARPATGRPGVHRPDLPRWSGTVWVDCMHTDGPGLARLGRRSEAVRLMREAVRALQRSDGLFDHGYDVAAGEGNRVAWGRGQGWALYGLVGTLREHRDGELLEALGRLVAALGKHELDGRWRTVIDDPAAPVELSTSAYVALALPAAVELGLVEAAAIGMADRALVCVLAASPDGVLPTSEATPIGRTARDYYRRRLGLRPWGQGPLLLALLDRMEGP